jgi:serine/threonine-protein kinase
MSTVASGAVLGRWRLEAPLAHGGQATVYRARHETLPRHAAVKVVHPEVWADPGFRARFRRECEALVALEHPNVVPVYDAGEVAGRGYLVMRLATGGTLAERLRRGRPAPAEALAILRQVASALDAAHGAGRLHRDVKPSNVLLEPDGHAWLADFGLARTTEATTETGEGLIVGTPSYLAPEVIAGGRAGPAADRYALACLAYELLTGEPPFVAERAEPLLYAHVHRPPPSAAARAPGLSVAVDGALARGLDKDPERRPSSAGAFVADLASSLDAPTLPMTLVQDRAPTERLPAPRRRRGRGRWALAALAIIVAAAAAAVVLVRPDAGSRATSHTVSPPPPPPPAVPGPDGAPLRARPPLSGDVPALRPGLPAAVARTGGVRVAAVGGGDPVGVIGRARTALEARGYGSTSLVAAGEEVGLLEGLPSDPLGLGPRWALLVERTSRGRVALIVHGQGYAVIAYVDALAHLGLLTA